MSRREESWQVGAGGLPGLGHPGSLALFQSLAGGCSAVNEEASSSRAYTLIQTLTQHPAWLNPGLGAENPKTKIRHKTWSFLKELVDRSGQHAV